MNNQKPLRIVILSEAKDLLFAARCRPVAALGMTKSYKPDATNYYATINVASFPSVRFNLCPNPSRQAQTHAR